MYLFACLCCNKELELQVSTKRSQLDAHIYIVGLSCQSKVTFTETSEDTAGGQAIREKSSAPSPKRLEVTTGLQKFLEAKMRDQQVEVRVAFAIFSDMEG